MTGADPGGPELLEGWDGRAAWPGRERAADGEVGALTRFARRHRRWVTVGALAAVGAAGIGYAAYEARPPQVPAIQVTADRSADTVPLWSAGPDGRPSSTLTVSVTSSLAEPGTRQDGTVVTPIGLAGPGLSSPGAFPRSALTPQPAAVELTGQVACDRVPIPVPTGAYTVRVEVTDGGRSRQADLPLGAAAAAISGRVSAGCSTWLAARDVTLTAVASAVVDPVRPHVDLALTVTNRGGLPAWLWGQDPPGSGIRQSAVDQAVPAHGVSTVQVSVDLDRCWSWDGAARPVTALDTPVQLLAASGVTHAIPPDVIPPLDWPAPGLVLSPAAAGQLRDVFVRACGGIASMLLLTDQGGSFYDPNTHRLTVHVLVDSTPGTVQRLRLLPSADGGTDLVPLFGPSPWLVPDQSGQAQDTVAFEVPAATPCLGGGPYVPLDVLAAAGPGGQGRVVRFSLSAETFLTPDQVQAACSAG